MNCTLAKADLDAALKVSGGIAKPKTAYGEWILIEEGVGLASQGISVRVEMRLPESKIPKGGKLLLHEKTLRDLLPNLEPEISIKEGRQYLELCSGKFKSKLIAFAPENYPPAQVAHPGKSLELDLAKLQSAIKDVEFAIADSVDRASKEAFSGITFRAVGGTLQVIGARDPLLASTKLQVPEDLTFDFTLPREVATIIGRLAGEKIRILDLEARGRRIETETVTIRTSVLQAKLPDLEPIFSRPRPLCVKAAKEDLRRAVRQIEVFKDRHSRIMTAVVEGDTLKISAISQIAGKASATIPIGVEDSRTEKTGKTTVGLDVQHITEIVERCRDEIVVIEIGSMNELAAFPGQDRIFLTVTATPDKDFEEE